MNSIYYILKSNNIISQHKRKTQKDYTLEFKTQIIEELKTANYLKMQKKYKIS